MIQLILLGFIEAQVFTFLMGVLGSLASSALFLATLLLYFQPKIKISSDIAVLRHEGGTMYAFKFVNLTSYPLFDVRCELHHCRPDFTGVKENRDSKRLELIRDSVLYIPAEDKKDGRSLHAIILHTKEDLRSMVDGSSYITLTIVARHQLSGATRLFREDFLRGSLKHGRHKPGNKYEVVSRKR